MKQTQIHLRHLWSLKRHATITNAMTYNPLKCLHMWTRQKTPWRTPWAHTRLSFVVSYPHQKTFSLQVWWLLSCFGFRCLAPRPSTALLDFISPCVDICKAMWPGITLIPREKHWSHDLSTVNGSCKPAKFPTSTICKEAVSLVMLEWPYYVNFQVNILILGLY